MLCGAKRMMTMKMKNKVYFAGSIKGGRADAGLYKRMIQYIQKSDIVLTEHVGDLSLSKIENHLDAPTNTSDAIAAASAIYAQDTGWLKESDLVIAECTTPSLGVGYEMAFAEKCGIPVHIFYNSERTKLSAMLLGNSYFHIHPYSDEDEIFPLIDKILGR